MSVDRKRVDFKKTKIFQRDFANFEPDSFREVYTQNWDIYWNNVNERVGGFYWKLDACVNRHAQLKKLIQPKAKPWLTSEIAKMISHMNKRLRGKNTNLVRK